MRKVITFEIVDGYDEIIDEKDNTTINLRKIKWGESDNVKLDLRKWHNTVDGETVGKGVSFLTEEGPNKLAEVLVNSEYGNMYILLNSLKNRESFIPTLKAVIEGKDIEDTLDDIFYDPKDLLN